jgi:hypothetical protein
LASQILFLCSDRSYHRLTGLLPHIRRQRLQGRFLEPFCRCIRGGEDLEVLGVANLLAGVDVDKDGHRSLFSLRLPQWCPLLSVKAITVAIDAEKALGNRDYFLNKPYGVG